MQTYQSHKKVQAFKIVEIIDGTDIGVDTSLVESTDGTNGHGVSVDDEYMMKHQPEVGGYYVRYEDGYESWSPAEAFESGYTLIPS